MTVRKRLVGWSILVAMSGAMAACAADGSPVDESSDVNVSSPLAGSIVGISVLSSSKEAGFKGVVTVEDETIYVESVTGDKTRHTTVTSSSGTSYARWEMTLADEEIVGTFGDRTLGRFEDRFTDMDPSVWAEVDASHVGEILRAVSPAASALLASTTYSEVSDEITPLAEMAGYLSAMTRAYDEPVEGQAPQAPECNYHNWVYDSYISICLVNGLYVAKRYARTGPGQGWNFVTRTCANCTRTYHVQMWDGAGHVLAADARTGCTALIHGFDSYLAPGQCIHRNSKHWDTFVHASWRFNIDCAPNGGGTVCG